MKQVEVTILGQSYLLACPDGGETLMQLAVAAVDREMSGIRDAGKVKARERIAVLAALNLAYRLAEAPRSVPAPASPGAAPAAESRDVGPRTAPPAHRQDDLSTDQQDDLHGAPQGDPHLALHLDHSEASDARRAASAQVDMLIQRLDTALSEDGRLL